MPPEPLAAWRLLCPPGMVTFNDRIVGPQTFDVAQSSGDFVVACKSSGFLPAYQLAVVLDDAADGVTTIIRGDDLLPSTARQILVGRALRQVGYAVPAFAYGHVPLVVGPDHRRLAERHGDTRLAEYRRLGVSAGRVLALGRAGRAAPRNFRRSGGPRDIGPAFDDFSLGKFAPSQHTVHARRRRLAAFRLSRVL